MTTKNINNFRILQIALLIIILAAFIPGLIHSGQLLFLEDESKVWGITYGLFGVDWSAYVQENSLISFGYSLLLAPVCAVINKTGAIYKVAVSGNAVALGISYVLSVYVTQKMYPHKSKTLISLACCMAALCPGFALVKFVAVPDMLLVLLFWIVMACFVSVEENPTQGKLIGLGIILGIGVMFHALMICVMIAGGIVLYKFVREGKVEEGQFWRAILCMVAFALLAQIIEKVLLEKVFQSTNPNTALGVLMSGMFEGWEKKGFFGLLQSMGGKLFCVGAGSLLTIFWGMMTFLKGRGKNTGVQVFYKASFLLVLVASALYYSSNKNGDDILNSRILFVIAGPIIIRGIIEICGNTKWIWYLNSAIGFLVLTAFVCADKIKEFPTDTIEYFNTGVLFSGLERFSENMQSNIYSITIVIVILAIVLLVLVKNNLVNKKGQRFLAGIGAIGAMIALCTLNILMMKEDVIEEGRYIQDNYAKVTSLISETSSEVPVYYLAVGKSEDKEVAKAQYLLGKRQISYIDETQKEKSKEELKLIEQFQDIQDLKGDVCVLMSAEDPRVDNGMGSYGMVDLTENQALFSIKESQAYESMQKASTVRVYALSLGEDKENLTSLSPGTYECTVSVSVAGAEKGDRGIVSVASGNTIVQKTTFTVDEEVQSSYDIGLTFATQNPLEDINISVKRKGSGQFDISRAIYRKVSEKYRIGINDESEFLNICNIIKALDSSAGTEGSIGVIGNEYVALEDLDLSFLMDQFPNGKTITHFSQDEDTRYLLALTNSRAFFEYMEQYSVIEMNDSYTLLVKRDEISEESLEQNGLKFLSDGKKLNLDEDVTNPVSIISGNYLYVFGITADINAQEEKLGAILLKDGEKVIARKDILKSETDQNGQLELNIPIAVREDIKALTFEIEGDSILEATPLYLEMTADKFQVGSDEPEEMEALIEIVKKIDIPSQIYYVTTEKVKKTGIFSFEKLQEELPDYKFVSATQSEVKYLKTDCFLLLEDFNSGYLGLTKYYTMIAQEGYYSLWVANYGDLMNSVYENGISMVTSGYKVPVSSLKSEEEKETLAKTSIGELTKGTYEVTLSAKAERKGNPEMALLQLIGKESEEKAIDAYIKQAIRAGTMSKEDLTDESVRDSVRKFVPCEEVLATYEIDSESFREGDLAIITVNFELSSKVEEIEVRVVNYYDNCVTVEPKWIEKK